MVTGIVWGVSDSVGVCPKSEQQCNSSCVSYGTSTVEFPITIGTENQVAIRDEEGRHDEAQTNQNGLSCELHWSVRFVVPNVKCAGTGQQMDGE